MTAGEIAYDELNKALRSGGKVQLDANLQAGAAGTIDTNAVNKSKGGGSTSPKRGGKGGKGAIGKPAGGPKKPKQRSTQELIVLELVKVLTKNGTRLEQLFKTWDTDGNGSVDRKEWHPAMEAIGIRTTRENVDVLFDIFDINGDGEIEYSVAPPAAKRPPARPSRALHARPS